jgi:hypothetical protein
VVPVYSPQVPNAMATASANRIRITGAYI